MVVWTGPIEDLGDAGGFDALFCHDDDEKRLMSLFVALTPPGEPGNQDGATSQGITALDQRSMTAPP
ncbi:hypothetical protein [uncultured Rhodoblastus sp.]|uniref:hypothetical protein n=1 Tax=uncultured Rhodoblastus sp. TaxID=543037 RepID=UPI0025E480E5|nr:hypothetical protein [uncultured Rhodoblastus sp.]